VSEIRGQRLEVRGQRQRSDGQRSVVRSVRCRKNGECALEGTPGLGGIIIRPANRHYARTGKCHDSRTDSSRVGRWPHGELFERNEGAEAAGVSGNIFNRIRKMRRARRKPGYMGDGGEGVC